MPSISILPLPSTNQVGSTSSSSSSSAASFPFVGFLGLTPVVLEGLILSRLSAPEKPLLASSVEVNIRCIESRLSGAFGVLSSEVLWSSREVVWRAGKSAPPREDGLVRRGVEEALGDWEGKFKIMIPLEEGKKAGRSTVSLREYRVVWKLEVVIHHRTAINPNDRFSKSIEVPLLLHSSPPSPTLPSDTSFSANSYALVSSSTTLPSTIYPPLGAYGPGETIPIHLSGFLPSNRATIKRVVVSLRRRLEFLPATAATTSGEETISSGWSSEVNTPADDLGGTAAGGSSNGGGGEFYEMGMMDSSLSVASYATNSPLLSPAPSSSSRAKPSTSSRLTSFFSPRSSSNSLPPARRTRSPSLEPSSLSSRSASASSSSSSIGGSGSGGKKSRRASTPPTSSEVITTKVLEVESDAIKAVGLKEWEADVELVLPRVKGSSRWTIGETGKTGMMTLGFELKVTVVVQPVSSSASDPPQSSSASSSSSFITPSAIQLSFPHTFPIIVTSTSQSDRSSAALLAVPTSPSQFRTRSSSSRSKTSSTTRSSSSAAAPTSPSRPRPSRPSMGTRSTSASSSSSMYSLGNGSSFRGLEADVEQPRMSRSSGRSRRPDDSGGAPSPLGPPSPRADPRSSYRSSRTADAYNRTRDEHRSPLSPRNGPSQSSLSSSSNASTSTVRLQTYTQSPTSDLPTSLSTTSFESNDSASTTTSHHPSRPSNHISPPSGYSSAFHRQIVSNLSTDTFGLGLPPLPVSSPSASSTTTFALLTPPPPALQNPIPLPSRSSKLGRFLSLSPPSTTQEEDSKRLMATLIQGGRRISINPSEEEEDHPRRRVKVGVTGGEVGWGEGVVDFSPVAGDGEKSRGGGSSKRRPSTAPGGPVGAFGFERG